MVAAGALSADWRQHQRRADDHAGPVGEDHLAWLGRSVARTQVRERLVAGREPDGRPAGHRPRSNTATGSA